MLAVPARFLWNNRERDAENACRRKLLAGDGGQEGFEARRPMSAPAPGPPRAGLAASGEALKWPAIALAQCFDISASIVPSFCPDSIRKFRPKRPAPQVIFKFPENFPPRKHQGSASGKRNKGCPEPPTKSPPNQTRGEMYFKCRRMARAGRRFPIPVGTYSEDPRFKRTCTHVQVCARVFSFGPSTARFLFGKTKRKWGVDCQAINIAYIHPIGKLPASAQKKREAHASLFLSALLGASKPFKQTPVLSEWLSF